MMHDVRWPRTRWMWVLPALEILLFSPHTYAVPTPEEVSRHLVAAFQNQTGRTDYRAPIQEKSYVGFTTRTITFSIGPRVYRIVFSSDDTITVALTQEGDIGAQPLWSASATKTTVEELINLVYFHEFGRKYRPAEFQKPGEGETAEQEEARLTGKKGAELRLDRLMNRVLSGDTLAIADSGQANADQSFSKAAEMGKMLDPCKANQSAAQRSAVTDIAQVLAAASFGDSKGANESFTSRSRNYKKHGSTSVLRDLKKYEPQANPEEAFRLIQQTRSDAYALFTEALRSSDPQARDPYSLAAHRNFRNVARGTGEAQGRKLVDRVLSQTVVEVDPFVRLRRIVPNAPVIYDRTQERYYIDPTLNSPAQARYLLSLAVVYAWKLQRPETQSLLEQYQKTRDSIARIEHAILDESDERELTQNQAQARKLSTDLFKLVDELRKIPTRPNS